MSDNIGDTGDFDQPDQLHPKLISEVAEVIENLFQGGNMGAYDTLKGWRNDEPEFFEEVTRLSNALEAQGVNADELAARVFASQQLQDYFMAEVDDAIQTLMGSANIDEDDDDDEGI